MDEFKRLFEKTAAGGGKERAAEAEKQRARRRQLQNEYGRLYEEVAAILFESDPIGINFGDNPDEYYPEVDTILPRLRSCSSPEEVQTVVYEEFLKSLCAEIGSPRIHAASR